MKVENYDSPLISVIVPVYNTVQYLQECVDSIRSQSYSNIEIVLVDDGSSDGSADLCDVLASSDSRVCVVHEENSGPSAARNTGLASARGKIVAFVDSDDCISPAYIEMLYRALNECGTRAATVPGGIFFKDGDSYSLIATADEAIDRYPVDRIDANAYMERILYQRVYSGCHWWMFKRDVLPVEPFSEEIIIGEDVQVAYRALHAAGAVALVDCQGLYAYRLRPSSLVHQEYSHAKGTSVLAFTEQLYSDVSEWYPELLEAAASRCFAPCRSTYASTFFTVQTPEVEDDRESLWTAINKYKRAVAGDKKAAKKERVFALVACLGKTPFRILCQARNSLARNRS